MACDFCATAQGDLVRSLTAGEIVEQFFHLRREAAGARKELRTLVMMGMGEPLQNLDAVVPAAQRIGWGELGAMGFAQITVSTVGLVPKIDELAASDVPVALALSLHAPASWPISVGPAV